MIFNMCFSNLGAANTFLVCLSVKTRIEAEVIASRLSRRKAGDTKSLKHLVECKIHALKQSSPENSEFPFHRLTLVSPQINHLS